MPWELRETSGPHVAPWEGRDATAWIWEVYQHDESRRVIVEVSGTAMAVAAEYLPRETAEARATEGRSEVEKVLQLVEPPRRITLGTLGYVGAPPKDRSTPDFLLINAAGEPVAAVEVKNPRRFSAADVASFQSQLAHVWRDRGPVRFVLAVSQERGFLFDEHAQPGAPAVEFPMADVIRHYYPSVGADDRLRDSELALIVQHWLADLAGGIRLPRPTEEPLANAGFLEAVRGTRVESENV
jgi:hypothetical protein